MARISDQWINNAQYDLETARAMYRAKRYQYVIFYCQQLIEKIIKAIILDKTNEFPPRIHQLMRLIEKAGITVSDQHVDFLRELSAY